VAARKTLLKAKQSGGNHLKQTESFIIKLGEKKFVCVAQR